MRSIIIELPESIIRKVEEKGYNIIDLILDTLVKKVNIDPNDIVEVRLKIAERTLKEAEEYIERGDPVQASEKIYKTVEECIKALAIKYKLPEYEEASKEGRWWTQLLGKAARKLSRKLNEPKITDIWSRAYEIHVWGFHEAKYNIEDIKDDIKYAE